MNPEFLISVIVTTYNRPDALFAVLQGLLAQTDPHFEIIVADDGSAEPTRALMATLQADRANMPPRLVHAWQPDAGFRASAVRNLGVHASRGQYLVFLDGDCVPRPDYLARHRALAEPGYMVSGSRVLLDEGLTRRLLAADPASIFSQSRAFWLRQRLSGHINKFLPLLWMGNHAMRHYRRVKWQRIKSCNLAIWRSDYEKVNGFDETFVGWGHEDADLVLRLARVGVKRKGGAFATEVFHLWHKENTRTTESENRKRVEDRMHSQLVEAPRGLRDHPQPDEQVHENN